MKSVLCFVALVALVLAENPDDGYYYGPSYHGGHHRGGYRSRPAYHAPGPYVAPTPAEYEHLDTLDKLYSRLDTVQDELKTGSSLLANLESRLSLSKQDLEILTTITSPLFTVEDQNQDTELDQLQETLDIINDKLDQLENHVIEVEILNDMNLNDQENITVLLAAKRRRDIEQEGAIARAQALVADFKPRYFQSIGNDFDFVQQNIDSLTRFLASVKEIESKKLCETGQVTLDADDRKAEYLFQTAFAVVPQILYSVCGYNFDLEARPNDYDHYYKEPNALGLLVTAEASRTGLTVEMFDQSFGDSQVVTADVCFQVCSIGPGTDALPHMSMMPL